MWRLTRKVGFFTEFAGNSARDHRPKTIITELLSPGLTKGTNKRCHLISLCPVLYCMSLCSQNAQRPFVQKKNPNTDPSSTVGFFRRSGAQTNMDKPQATWTNVSQQLSMDGSTTGSDKKKSYCSKHGKRKKLHSVKGHGISYGRLKWRTSYRNSHLCRLLLPSLLYYFDYYYYYYYTVALYPVTDIYSLRVNV